MQAMYTNIDENRRIVVTTERLEWAGPNAFLFDFPDDFNFSDQNEYIIDESKKLVYSPKPVPVEKTIAELKSNLASTDYVVQKITEAQVGAIIIPEDDQRRYEGIIKQRQAWREEINRLEVNGQ